MTQVHLKQLLKKCYTDLSIELQKSKYGCLFFFGMSKTDPRLEEKVNALRDRPSDMKGLKYPQVIVDGTESLPDTQRKLKGLLKNMKKCDGMRIMDGTVQKTLSVEVNYYRSGEDEELPYFLL